MPERTQRQQRKQSKRQQNQRSQTRRRRQNQQCRQNGGDGQMGHTVLPSEYFGVNSGRYFEAGAPELNETYNTAYGPTRAVSFGVQSESMNEMGPNLAPGSNTVKATDIQTGGSRKNRKSQRKRRGGMLGALLSAATNLVVPAGLWGSEELLKTWVNRKNKTQKSSKSPRSNNA